MASANDDSISNQVLRNAEDSNNETLDSVEISVKNAEETGTEKTENAENENGSNSKNEKELNATAKSEIDESESQDSSNSSLDSLREYFGNLCQGPKSDPVLSELTLKGVAEYMLSDKCQNIIIMTGAGISTSAGIPDFRSPDSGLYSQLEKYNLPYPESIFVISYFKNNPHPFFKLAKELYPGNFKPTPTHHFINLVHQKGKLLRNYTQNIDGLEIQAGLPADKVLAAHGTFRTSHCVACDTEHDEGFMKAKIFADEIPRCTECDGLVKPDIVFFGEALPQRFFFGVTSDFPVADLLIIMGTSLKVQPFASLIERVNDDVPRLLINREKCGQEYFGGLDFDSEEKYRDVLFLGDCDDGCDQLAEALGWKEELDAMVLKNKM